MTTPRILRDSALALPLPLLAGLGAWLEGPWGAAGVVASALVTLVNLAVLYWVVDTLVRATAAGHGGGGAVGVIFGKTAVVLIAYGSLLAVFPTLSVALGLGVGLIGLTVHGLFDAALATGEAASAEGA